MEITVESYLISASLLSVSIGMNDAMSFHVGGNRHIFTSNLLGIFLGYQ